MKSTSSWFCLCIALCVAMGLAEGQSSCIVADDCTAPCPDDKTHMSCINKQCVCRSHDQSQFIYHHERLDYDAAKDACLKVDTQLVKVNTSAKYNLIQTFLDAQTTLSDPWIGLRLDPSKLPSYVYRYVDGSFAHYFVWDTKDREPNSQSSDHCIRLKLSNKQMRTSTCSDRHTFICERTTRLGCVAKNDCSYRCTGAPEFHCVNSECKCGSIV